MNHKALLIIITFLVTASVFASTANAAVIQTDKTGTVTSVIDGSTFTISTGETIKLAEIITPASGEAGFESSRNYLANLIQEKTVILDVDTLVVSDQGKLLCVAYVDFNSSHYENIKNKAILENNYAAPTSTRTTEFNPSTWTWFIAKETAATPTPTAAATATATPSPTPTPFSAPTPSITPDVSQPTATPTSTTPSENTKAAAQMQTWIIIAVVGVVAVALVVVFVLKRRK